MVKSHRIVLLTLCCLLFSSPAYSEDLTLSYGTPEQVSMSADVLKASVALYEEAVAQDQMRGVVLLVARRGKVVLHEAIGWANKEDNRPMQKGTLFRMASNIKPLTATAIMVLAEDGKLRLDDKVAHYLPVWRNSVSGEVRIHHLLSHMGGFHIHKVFITPLIQKSDEYPEAPCLRAEVDRFGRIGPGDPPGLTFSYSDPGYNTLGRLIEVASCKPIKDFFKERIYEPLGMKDSWNYESDAPEERMARVYRRREGKWVIEWSPDDGPDWPFVRTSGGMITSPWDYAVFCQMFLNGGVYGGKRLLGAEMVEAATTIQNRAAYTTEDFERQTSFYGYGWFLHREGIYSHPGSDGTFAWVDPQHQIIGLVFTQGSSRSSTRKQFQRVVTAACYDVRGLKHQYQWVKPRE